jgi:hypothetical protein
MPPAFASAPPADDPCGPRAAAAAAAADERARLGRRIGNARLAVFLVAALCLGAVLLDTGIAPAVLWASAGVALVGFAGLVAWHDRVLRAQRRALALRDANLQAQRRAAGELAGLPGSDIDAPPGAVELARDLQLFGPGSLAVLLGTVSTPFGRDALASWLVTPASAAEVAARQEAVRELAPLLDLRQELEILGRLRRRQPALGRFLSWAEGADEAAGRPLPRPGVARWLSALTALAIVGWLVGGSPGSLVGVLAVLALGLWRWHQAALDALLGHLERGEEELESLADQLRLLADYRPQCARLQTALTPLADGGAETGLRELARLANFATLRHSGLHALANALALWDLHLATAFLAWRARHGARVGAWLTALGEAEALAALAALASEHPGWAFPRVDPAVDCLVAQGLAHPLLPAAQRVANDVALGPPGTVLLVTGSNMAGKSTLLRALGTNIALAQAGGPVCATALSLPPVELGTSLLVEDSLADGVSFFLAELKRLKAVVDQATAAHVAAAGGSAPRRLVYLLDEVLRGTNSADRRVAVERVLSRLLAVGAIGAVTTHDLGLAEAPGLAGALVPVHFREHFEETGVGVEMRFDYRLQPGLAPTTNALVLLRLVGLDHQP